jgi:hypothetical protein
MNISNSLIVLAADLNDALTRKAKSREDEIAAELDICRLFAEARAKFADNIGFGEWKARSGYVAITAIDAHTCAAYAAMGADLEHTKEVLARTERRSIRYIYEHEFRLPHVRKTQPTKPLPPKKVQTYATMQAAAAHGATVDQLATRHNVSEEHVREVLDLKLPPSEEELAAQPVSATEQKKRDAYKRKLEKEFEWRVRAAAQKMYDEWYENSLKRYVDQVAKIERQLQQHKGMFRRPQFVLLQKCLHPDTGRHIDDATRNEAFRLFMENEARLCDMTPERVFSAGWPKTREDLEARRAEVKARNSERARKAAASRKAKEVSA